MRINTKDKYKSWVQKQIEKVSRGKRKQKCSPKTRRLSK